MTTNLTALYGLGGGGSGKWRSQTITSSGLWRRPADVYVVKVLLVGGGGSGAASRILNGFNGGNSSFGDILLAEGGGRGLNYNFNKYNENPETSGFPGGIGSGFPTAYTYTINSNINPNFNPSFEGTSAILYNTKNTIPDGIIGISSAFGSTGGGGATGGSGGNVIGFGNGGAGPGGGGASYGNGGAGGSSLNGNIGQAGVFGGGGGGSGSAGGGGGGEIVYREVPVSADITVIIGSGGASVSGLRNGINYTSGAGGNGLCIVFWQE